MYAVKKIGKFSFICEKWNGFRCDFVWSKENESGNITLYNEKWEAVQVMEDLNSCDDNGNVREIAEVVELSIEEFRLV
jgi:hypothetical protein